MTHSKSDTDGLDGIFSEALEKYKRGAAKYGNFNPETDPRNLLKEAEAEILDAINYLGMFIMKMRARDDVHTP